MTIRERLSPTWHALPTEDKPEPEFLLRPLTPFEWLDVRHEIYETPKGTNAISSRGVRTALEAVLNWRNYTELGVDVKFSHAARLELPADWMHALALEIAHRAILSESERKNSRSPSTSQ
jgi:hypothetical protein